MNSKLEYLFELESEEHKSEHLKNLYNTYLNFLQNQTNSIDENIKTNAKNLLLTLDENFPIISYASISHNNFASKSINLSIITNDISLFSFHFINLLDLSLENLKPFNNSIIYRMVNDTYEDLASEINFFRKNIGQTFLINHFLSTSKVIWPSHKIIWRIETLPIGSRARDIENLKEPDPNKVKNGEREVLFSRESKFIINSVEKINSYYQVNLKEVEASVKHSLIFKTQLMKA